MVLIKPLTTPELTLTGSGYGGGAAWHGHFPARAKHGWMGESKTKEGEEHLND